MLAQERQSGINGFSLIEDIGLLIDLEHNCLICWLDDNIVVMLTRTYISEVSQQTIFANYQTICSHIPKPQK